MPLLEEKELEGLKREMEKLAEMLMDSGEDLDADCVSLALQDLVKGKSAEWCYKQLGLDGV